MNSVITITFGDVAENEAKMEKIGDMMDEGLSKSDLASIRSSFTEKGFDCKMMHLHRLARTSLRDINGKIPEEYKAYLLVVKGGADAFVSVNDVYNELRDLDWDKKTFMYGRVVNKKIRHNLCFGEYDQEPDYENKKGRVMDIRNLKIDQLRKGLTDLIPKFADRSMFAEGNNYYDVENCGIGYHGDAERKVTIGARFGLPMPLYYQWYEGTKVIGNRYRIDLNHGDIYFMSDVATGNTWMTKLRMRSKGYHLRHAAGFRKDIITPKVKK